MNDELMELPKGWITTKLGECLRLINGRAYLRHELLDQGTPIIRIQNLNGGDKWFYSDLQLDRDKYCDKGDLLFAWSATFGPFIWQGSCSIYHYHIWKIEPFEVIDQKFAYYLLEKITQAVKAAAHGVAMPHMTKQGMENWQIQIPPLNEQKRIVAKIEELRERSQKARSHLSAIPNLCDKFRQSVLAAAFRGDLTADWREQNPDVEPASMLSEALKRRSSQLDSDLEEYDLLDLPDSWIWVNIDSISDVKGGKRLPKGEKLVENDTGYPYIKAGNLKNGTVTLDDIEYIPTRIQPLIKNYVVAAGDVYITIVGACIGDAGTICKELDGANLTENAAKISNLSNANNEYLALWLRSPLCQKIIKTKILSAAQGKLALTRIKTIPVPLAPIQEQSEIVTKSADILKSSDQTTELYEKIQSNLDWLDRSILAKAFRGELVEQDPNDEPASILLERIRAEREQQTQGKAKKPGKKGQRTIKTDPP